MGGGTGIFPQEPLPPKEITHVKTLTVLFENVLLLDEFISLISFISFISLKDLPGR